MDWTPTLRYSKDEGSFDPERAHDSDAGIDLRSPGGFTLAPRAACERQRASL